jgi:hypothetical protein
MTQQPTTSAGVPRGEAADGEYIRSHYGVPAEIGRHVNFRRGDRRGVIVDFRGPYIGVRFYGDAEPVALHPTWQVEYLELSPPTPEGDGYTRQRDDRLLVAAGTPAPPYDQWHMVGAFTDGTGVFAPWDLKVHVVWPRRDREQDHTDE